MEASIRWADELVIALGGPAGPAHQVDWGDIATLLGTDVPVDFKYLAEANGAGEIEGGIIVTAPSPTAMALDFARYNQGITGDYRKYSRELAEDGFPYRFYPDSGGLIGWGYCGEGSFFWKSSGEPNSWTVVVMEVRGAGWFEFDGGMAEFLLKLIRREIIVDFMFEDGSEGLGGSFRRLG